MWCILHAGIFSSYPYTEDLYCLDGCRPAQSLQVRLPPVSTPLRLSAWSSRLQGHPDQRFSSYVLRGLEHGFRVGFNRQAVPLQSAKRNMQSALEHPEVVGRYVEEELHQGRFVGPLSTDPGIHVSRFGVIPKGRDANRWRLITDLSHPAGASVNDGINQSWCSLTYITVEEVSQRVVALGRGALMAKVDIKSAYRLVPIHPEDRPLLGVQWAGQCFIDLMLPFGLRSAPKIFTAIADALEWCIRRRGVNDVEHYLDDFIVFGPPASPVCQHSLDILSEECEALGVPLAVEKTCGPTTCLTFLGIEVDTMEAVLRLPAEKLERLRSYTAEWAQKRSCTKRDLESLVGFLQYCCKVVRPGRSFLRRMIALQSAVVSPHHHIRLGAEFRSDLRWWQVFATRWNGVSLLPSVQQPAICLVSDASGSWGCGAWCGSHWFQLQWSLALQPLGIAAKELIPVLAAIAIWGHEWARRSVLCHCDNQAVVSVMRSRYSRDPVLMGLLRCLFFFEAYYNCTLSATYIPGPLNDRADDLSRDRLPSFRLKVPQADDHATLLPFPLLRLLETPQHDWSSPSWIRLFSACVRRE